MKKKRLVQILALALAFLLAGGAVVTALISAWAEAETPARDACEMSIVVYEEEQALQISQRLVYTNRTDAPLDSVLFYLYGNMLRRESALVYEADELDAAFPAGYAPGGFDFRSVLVNGEAADWGVQGSDELYLRVACPLAPGERAEFRFEFLVLYTQNNGFLGAGGTDIRLSGFYPVPAETDSAGAFVANAPLSFARTMLVPALDYAVDISLPAGYDLACGGERARLTDGENLWHVDLTAHEFAFACGRRWRAYEQTTASGVTVRVLSNARGRARAALSTAVRTVEQYEAWFGAFPQRQITLAQSDIVPESRGFDGLILLNNDLFSGSAEALTQALRERLAEQYFGFAAYVDPAADAWLTDALSLYVAYLALEAEDGPDAYLAALNRDLLPALQLTMPGGLEITSAAGLFTGREYQVIVRERGAAVFHELRCATGRDGLIAGLRRFVEAGRAAPVLGEYDLVDALDAATGRSWEDYLADWLYHIDEYNVQRLDWLD